mmetsp:Transcript_81771/g.113560  ORF Transcript_81771/g.113560 Transcript_81771/m.113560 type:complete len:124 (-) Transcript_81771:44-415(-)
MIENQTAIRPSNALDTNHGNVARRSVAEGSKKTWLQSGPSGIPNKVPTTIARPKTCPWSSFGARLQINEAKHGDKTPKATPKVATPKTQKSTAAWLGKTGPKAHKAQEMDITSSAVPCTTWTP